MIQIFKFTIDGIYDFLNIPFSFFGYQISFWMVAVGTVILTITLRFVIKLMR